jgi:hypothetical protein
MCGECNGCVVEVEANLMKVAIAPQLAKQNLIMIFSWQSKTNKNTEAHMCRKKIEICR